MTPNSCRSLTQIELQIPRWRTKWRPCKGMAVSQTFIFHFKWYSLLHFALCQILCWAFLLSVLVCVCVSRHATPRHVTSRHVMSHHHHVTPCPVTLDGITLCISYRNDAVESNDMVVIHTKTLKPIWFDQSRRLVVKRWEIKATVTSGWNLTQTIAIGHRTCLLLVCTRLVTCNVYCGLQ